MADDIISVGIKIDTSGVENGNASLDAFASKGAKVDQAVSQVEAGAKRVGKSLETLGANALSATGPIERVSSSSERLGPSLRDASAQLTGAGASIAAVKASATAFSGAADAAAQSTRALNSQLRQVAPQFTDIVTSLSSGQPPLQVLIQQGGQLKDVFGGIGPAARALGGYVLGLVNPFTVAAAAASALGLAYFKGAAEAEAYNRALILTGNSAGVTAGRLGEMAQRISAASGTQREAAAALADLAGSTRIGAQNLEQFAAVAVQLEKLIGQPVAETRKQFEELGKAPVEASRKLNEQTNYLTAAVYAQIRALQDQGRVTEAAEVAQRAYAQAMAQRTKDLRDNLGTIERGWLAIIGAAKSAWDAMLGVGRQATGQEQLKAIDARIAEQQGQLERSAGSGLLGRVLGGSAQRELDVLRQQRETIVESLRLQDRQAALQGERARRNEAELTWADRLRSVEDDKTKRAREELAIRNEGLAAGKSELDIQRAIAAYREKNKGSGGAREPQGDFGRKAAEDYRATIERLLSIQAKYTDGAKEQTEAERALEDIRRNGTFESLPKAWRDATIAVYEQAKAVEDAARAYIEWEKAASRAADRAAALSITEVEADDRASNAAETARRALADQERATRAIGASKYELLQVTLDLIDAQIAEAEYNAAAAQDGSARQNNYREEARILRELKDARRAAFEKGQALDLSREMSEAARQSALEWQRASDRINQSLTDSLFRAAESGKDAFETLRDSVRGMFNNMVLRPLIQGAVTGVANASFGSSGLASAGSLSNLFTAGSNLLGGGTLGAAGATGLFNSFATSSAGQAIGLSAFNGSAELLGIAATELTSAGAALSSAVSAVSTAAPYIAVAYALYKAFAQDPGAPKAGGSFANTGERLFTPSAADALIGQVGRDLGAAINTAAARFGGRRDAVQFGLGFDTDPGGTADNRVASFVRDATGRALLDNIAGREVGRDDARLQAELATEGKRVLLAALQASDLTQGFADVFSRLDPASAAPEAIDSLFTLAEQLRAVGEAARDLPGVMGRVADLSATAREQLVGLAGGIDALTAQQQTYYTQFFSQDEQLRNAARVLGERFADVGLSFEALQANAQGPRAAFRQLVEGLDLTSEAGRQSYAALLVLATPLDQYLDGLEEAKGALGAAGDALDGTGAAAAAAAARVEALNAALSAGQSELDDLNRGISAVFRPAETVGDRLARMAEEVAALDAALAAATGSAGASNIERLRNAIGGRDALSAARQAIAGAIDEQMLAGFQTRGDTAGAVQFLQQLEGRLWESLASATDKNAVASRIQSVFLQRIGIEAQAAQTAVDKAAQDALEQAKKIADTERAARDARIAGLELELRNAEQFRDIAESLQRTVADLKFSDLSPLNPADQLKAAAAEFDRVLRLAQGGDLSALQQVGGVGTAYLQEAQGFFASTAGRADVFTRVTDALDALGVQLGASDVTDAQRQLDELRAIKDPVEVLTQTTVDYSGRAIDGLQAIDEALGAGVDFMNESIVQALAATQAQQATMIQVMSDEAAAAQARANALAVELAKMQAELAAIRDNTGGTRSAVQAVASAPEVVA